MPVQAWRTTDFSSAEQFAVWREVICEAFGALDPSLTSPDPNGFPGRVDMTSVQAIRCARVEAPPHRVSRAPAEIRRDPQEAYFVNLQLTGSCVTRQAGREALVSAGDFVVLDLAYPYTIDAASEFSIICCRVPHSHLVPRLSDPRRVGGRKVIGHSAPGKIASSFMHAMWANGGDLPKLAGESVEDIFSELVGLALTEGSGNTTPSYEAALRAAYGMIRQHLANPDLSPALIAHKLHISVRSLHTLFKHSGESFGTYVRKQRLARCAADLRNPADRRSVSEISWRWGFNDSAHFSRVFRKMYGASAREFRAEGASPIEGNVGALHGGSVQSEISQQIV